jgi:hypothetical protein
MNIASKAYESQMENLRQVGEVAKQGVSVAEYIGARQQLGRVKAQLSELDAHDPEFEQKYASIVADNPLAFTNEKIAPVTKAAITPLLASAVQARHDAAALERARVMAGYQAQRMAEQDRLRRGYYEYTLENPKPPAPHRATRGEEVMFGTPAGTHVTGAAPKTKPSYVDPGSAAVPQGVNMPGADFPVKADQDSPLTTPADMLPPADFRTPEGPPWPTDDSSEEGTGQGDSTDLTQGNGVAQGPGGVVSSFGYMRTPTGIWKTKQVTADGVTAEPYVNAAPPSPALKPAGYEAVPTPNPDGMTASSWEYKPIPESLNKQEQEEVNIMIKADPPVQAARSKAEIMKGQLDALVKSGSLLSPAEKEKLAPRLAEVGVETAAAVAEADALEAQYRLAYLARKNPLAAAQLAQRQAEERVKTIPVDKAQPDLTDTPPPKETSTPPPATAEEQIRRQNDSVSPKKNQDAVWDNEKKYVLYKAADLDRRLGLTPGTVASAAAKGDAHALQTIFNEAQNRGVKSPLLEEMQIASGESLGAEYPTLQWGTSPRLKRTYGEILRIAAKDPNYNVTSGSSQGYKWSRQQ